MKMMNVLKTVEVCGADFSLRGTIMLDGANCLLSCPAKQLEIEHEGVAERMITNCFPKKEVIFHSPKNTVITNDYLRWGWTNDIRKTICIPWYTLRIKKEFFDTMVHEMGHITAYEKLFSLLERNILYNFSTLQLKHELFSSRFTKAELGRYYKKHKKPIDRYRSWESHDYNPWYLEYLEFYKKLINSSFKKYAYGNTEPRDYGFNEKGEGEYKPKKIKIS